MAHSLSHASSEIPGGSARTFLHQTSGTRFSVDATTGTTLIEMTRDQMSARYETEWVIGSGRHAYGYLIRVGDYLYQAPISWYVRTRAWDMAPGFESDPAPDFTRPVSAECLQCHADQPRSVAGTLNRYENPPFASESISCDRCHGDPAAHLNKPGKDNIINPARLPIRARDSVCEQCHLSGEARILNPGREWADFKPGQELEDLFSIYVRDTAGTHGDSRIKVVSHSEQLALSKCALYSAGKLWCGTCHDPHNEPVQPIEYFRQRCLGCHGNRLLKTHVKPVENCVGCHMPKREAKDGAHTVFTDHRIARFPTSAVERDAPVTKLRAWHEARGALALRNLGLANLQVGERDRSTALIAEGAREVVQAMKDLPPDPAMLGRMGLTLLKAGEASDALEVLQYALEIAPDLAGSHVNLGNALREVGRGEKAIPEFERAIQLDPSLESAYLALGETWLQMNNPEAARKALERYLTFMPQNMSARKALSDAHAR